MDFLFKGDALAHRWLRIQIASTSVQLARARRQHHVPMSRFTAAIAPAAEVLDVPSPPQERRRIALRSGLTTYVVDPAAIVQLESTAAYVRVFEASRTFLVRGSLQAVMDRLAPASFVRVHRSAAVALHAIVELRRARTGKLQVVLANGAVVPASRVTREELERLVEAEVIA